MKRIILYSLVLISSLSFHSCIEDLSSRNDLYTGTWRGDYTILKIYGDGTATYDYYDGYFSEYLFGDIFFYYDNITIEGANFYKELYINQSPHYDDYYRRYVMVIDGELLFRD